MLFQYLGFIVLNLICINCFMTPQDTHKKLDYINNQYLINSIDIQDEWIIYPTLKKTQGISTLSLKNPKKHVNKTILGFKFKKQKIKIFLKLNRDITQNSLAYRVIVSPDNEGVASSVSVVNCFYSGRVSAANKRSYAAVSTCHPGVRGIIHMNNVTYHIIPLKSRNKTKDVNLKYPHLLYTLKPERKAKTCDEKSPFLWNKTSSFTEDIHHPSNISNNIKKKSKLNLRISIIADRSMCTALNGERVEYIIQLINIIDSRIPGINVILQSVKYLCYNRLSPRTDSARVKLHRVAKFHASSNTDIDITQLLTIEEFTDAKIGFSRPNSLCSKSAYGVTKIGNIQNLDQNAKLLAQQILIILGLEELLYKDKDSCALSWNLNKRINFELFFNKFKCINKKRVVKRESLCGDGMVQEDEECDPGIDAGACCHPGTCLLHAWATCDSSQVIPGQASCCRNCTFSAAMQVCRPSRSFCDVPDHCNGHSPICPVDELVRDGQLCPLQGHCYRGQCVSALQQCQRIWGQDSAPGNPSCFSTQNTRGDVLGHCGRDDVFGNYTQCLERDANCGLLQCRGKHTLQVGQTSYSTRFRNDGKGIICSVVESNSEGMVQDGTKCSANGVCLSSRCTDVDFSAETQMCPSLNGLVCSGHGVCTTLNKCRCNQFYLGDNCEITRTNTLSVVTEPNTYKVVKKKSTIYLIMILATAFIVGTIIFAFFMLCYRRRSPLKYLPRKSLGHQRRRKKKKLPIPTHSPLAASECGSMRLISFGNMPSYRADKIKKAKYGASPRRVRESGALSEGEAYYPPRTRPVTNYASECESDVCSTARRGILKKSYTTQCIQRLQDNVEPSTLETKKDHQPPHKMTRSQTDRPDHCDFSRVTSSFSPRRHHDHQRQDAIYELVYTDDLRRPRHDPCSTLPSPPPLRTTSVAGYDECCRGSEETLSDIVTATTALLRPLTSTMIDHQDEDDEKSASCKDTDSCVTMTTDDAILSDLANSDCAGFDREDDCLLKDISKQLTSTPIQRKTEKQIAHISPQVLQNNDHKEQSVLIDRTPSALSHASSVSYAPSSLSHASSSASHASSRSIRVPSKGPELRPPPPLVPLRMSSKRLFRSASFSSLSS